MEGFVTLPNVYSPPQEGLQTLPYSTHQPTALLSASELMMFILTDRCFENLDKNPFAREIPCHRMVKTIGDLSGFAYDISLKIKRLQAEGVSVKNGKIVNFQNICL
jgi:hypothetical protein